MTINLVPLAGFRILIAEADASMREYLSCLLSPYWPIQILEEGQNALDIIRETTRHTDDNDILVLIDIVMPKFTGVHLLKGIKKDPVTHRIPVILMAEHAEEDFAQNLIGIADDFIFKPLSSIELVARIKLQLELNKQRNTLLAELKERKKLEAKLLEIDQHKNDFLATLSHELRNPLATIANSTYMLTYAHSGSNIAYQVQNTIRRQVKQITRLVDDLLDVARISQNKIQLQCQPIDVNEIIKQTIEDNRTLFAAANIQLAEKLAEQPIMIDADPARIAQVVGNLLQNAAKFSLRNGRTQISVDSETESQQVIIRVADDGVGIDIDLQKKLFEPFMQADRTLDRSSGGLGLGLSLVKGLVELHGGTVKAVSAGPGLGAEFIVKLPITEMPQEPKLQEVIAKPSQKNNKSVLIIEDNIAGAESLRHVLESFGHRVFVYYKSEKGIENARKLKPHVVICDIGIPNQDGYEIAKIFKADKDLSSICLIAISGYAGKEHIEKARIAGFDHHMAKPPNLTMLEQLLN